MTDVDMTEAHFSTPIPEHLWHYTKVEGFLGILRSGKVWATDVRFLNDPEEFAHSREFALAHLQSSHVQNASPLARIAVTETVEESFATGVMTLSQIQLYVVSFSAAKNDLTQWKEYSSGCTGASISFDLRYIRPKPEWDKAVRFAPCIYDDSQKRLLIGTAINQFVDAIERLIANVDSPLWVLTALRKEFLIRRVYGIPFSEHERNEMLQQIVRAEIKIAAAQNAKDLFSLASHCKHSAYFHEQEWRLTLPVRKDTTMTHTKRQTRTSGGLQIPYIAINLFRSRAKLPINGVMLGSCWDSRVDADGILAKSGYDIRARPSGIPVRCVA